MELTQNPSSPIPSTGLALYVVNQGEYSIQLYETVNGLATGKSLVAKFAQVADLVDFLADNLHHLTKDLVRMEIERTREVARRELEAAALVAKKSVNKAKKSKAPRKR